MLKTTVRQIWCFGRTVVVLSIIRWLCSDLNRFRFGAKKNVQIACCGTFLVVIFQIIYQI